jgi:hypothetical protein
MTDSKTEAVRRADRREQGFALVLAILSLMLLTFLGLTLAATTSTELQIATNYRWSQQALYNAEAGIEAGKLILRNITDATFVQLLPPDRGAGVKWQVSDVPVPRTDPPALRGTLPRDYENAGCDNRGGGTGYGVVLTDTGVSADEQGSVQYRTVLFGQRLNGAVTLWVRRGVVIDSATGDISDSNDSGLVVLTAEGIAPFSEEILNQGGQITSFARAQMAVRTREVVVMRGTVLGGVVGDPCESYRGQTGGGQSGTGFSACGRGIAGNCKAADMIKGALNDAARDQGGTLDHAGGAGGDTGNLCDTNVE